MKNLKTGFAIAIIIACAVLLFLQKQAQEKVGAENELLRQQIAQLKTDDENLSNRLAAIGDCKSLADEQMDELLRLRGEVGVLRRQTSELGDLPQENARLKEANLSLPGILLLENASLEQHEKLRSANEVVGILAKNLNVPDAITMNVYAYTNLDDNSLDAYQPYFKAVQTRDEISNFTAVLDKKIGDEKTWLQGKLQ
jgi:hypothetical protein